MHPNISPQPCPDPSDEVLMLRYRDEKDRVAFDELWKRYYFRLYVYLLALTRNNRSLADDLAQESFVRVLTKAHLFDTTKGTFCQWIYKIATHLHTDNVRKRNPFQQLVDKITSSSWMPSVLTDPPVSLQVLICQCLDLLTLQERQVIDLYFYEGLTLKETAEVMNMTISQIYDLLSKATTRVARILSAKPTTATLRSGRTIN